MKETIAALYGAGGKSLLADRVLRSHAPDVTARYLVESMQLDKIDRDIPSLDGDAVLRIISTATLKTLYDSGKIDLVIIPAAYGIFQLRQIRSGCEAMGISTKDIYVVPWSRLYAPLEKAAAELDPLIPIKEALFIDTLDIHIVDHCNLRCKACAHFSNCVENETVYSLEFLRRNCGHLQTLIPDIHRICLLGGEPLLHPNIGEIIAATREIFPLADIHLVTNGLLLESVSPDFLDIMRKLDICISLSLSPPLFEKADALKTFLQTWGGQYFIWDKKFFERRLVQESLFEAQNQFAKCGHNMALRGPRLGYCVMALYTDYYNKYFRGGAVKSLPEDRGVDIFAHKTGKSLMDALQQPLELCSQCVSCDAGDLFFEKWEDGTTPEPGDWFIKPSSIDSYRAANRKEDA